MKLPIQIEEVQIEKVQIEEVQIRKAICPSFQLLGK